MRFRITRVRPAPEGFGDSTLALVNVELYPEGETVKLTRWSKAKRKNYEAGKIVGAQRIAIEVQLNEGNNGPWVAVGNVELSQDVADAIAAEAADINHQHPDGWSIPPAQTSAPAARPPAQQPHQPQPRGQYDPAGDTFATGEALARTQGGSLTERTRGASPSRAVFREDDMGDDAAHS